MQEPTIYAALFTPHHLRADPAEARQIEAYDCPDINLALIPGDELRRRKVCEPK